MVWKWCGAFVCLLMVHCVAGTGEYLPVEALDDAQVWGRRVDEKGYVFKTLRDTTIELRGASYFLPKGTIVDNGDLGGIVFPRETEVPVGPNRIPFAPHEYVFMYFSDSVLVQSGVLGHDIALRVGARTLPFEAARNSPESKRWRGEYQIRFHDNGTVREGFVGDTGVTLTIAGQKLQIPGGMMIRFHENGAISELPVSDGTMITVGDNRIACRQGMVHFTPSETVRAVTFADTCRLRVGDTLLTFTESGGSYATNRFDRVDGPVMFHENGAVRWGVLADTTTFSVLGRPVAFVPQGVYFDSLGRVEILAHRNELLRYKTLTPMLEYHDEPNRRECVDCRPDSAFAAIPQGRLTQPTTFTIGGNRLTFSRRKGIGNPGLGRGTITGSLIPGQALRVGANTVRVWDLAPVSGSGDIFFVNGVPMGVKLYEDCELRVGDRMLRFRTTRHCPGAAREREADLGFHSDGSVSFGVVAEPIEVSLGEREPAFLVHRRKTIRLRPGQRVYFNRDGSVKFILQENDYLVWEYATDTWAPEDFEPQNCPPHREIPSVRFDAGKRGGRRGGAIKVTATNRQEVYVDGHLMGETPLVVTDLPLEGHRVGMYDDGWLARELEIDSGQVQALPSLVTLMETLPGTRDSMAVLPSEEQLQQWGGLVVHVPRGDTLQIHYQLDYRAGTMQYYYFNANPHKCIAHTEDPGLLTNLGWLMMSDFGDSAAFARYTEAALRRQQAEGVRGTAAQANEALLTVLHDDSAGAAQLYREALANTDDPQWLRQSICGDFDELERWFPELEARLFRFRQSLGFCGSE